MGLFGNAKNNWHKAQAAALIQGMLEIEQSAGAFSRNPAQVANNLVGTRWDVSPHVFDGSSGMRPHKISIAAAALIAVVHGALNNDKIDLNILALWRCLSKILLAIGEGHVPLHSLNILDDSIIQGVVAEFDKILPSIELASRDI